MNAPFNPVSFIHRLEAEGIARGAAEAIAQGIEDRNRELATSQGIHRLETGLDARFERVDAGIEKLTLELEKFATKAELKLELQATVAKQAMRFAAMLVAVVGLPTGILGTIIALR